MKNKLELFVPGRLCIIGEHSDWAGLHRMTNANIVPGHAIVTGIEQGIYATAEKADKFIVSSKLALYKDESFSCEMENEELDKVACAGGFFSYVAGVASYINENYSVGGVRIEITRMDLPIKSGLSSSAAICVLVARAFNQLYNLHLNTMGEMRAAYFGEQRTPSRCGRLDQACAFGIVPVNMVFDGSEIKAKPVTIKKPMHFVVANLNAGKNTVKILGDLNKCYPFAQNELEENVQEALGKDNEAFIREAVNYIEDGDNEALGKLMVRFQENFDKKVAPASPEQLAAPVLHSVLNDEKIKAFIYGAKGVGSQGDGTVQFLCKNAECQKALMKYLKNELGMDNFPLSLKPQKAVKRAIIPVAGFGTRMFPATKIMKKDFLPVMDRDGVLKPVLLILLEQLIEAGIEEICLVIAEDEKPQYDAFFGMMSSDNYDRLPEKKKYYQRMLLQLQGKIKYVYQNERKGFGHAVYQCREFTKDEPVMLLLGDMIYHSNRPENCMQQMMDVFERYGQPIVSLHKVPKEDVVHYGILHGSWEDQTETVLKLDSIFEKPSIDYAGEYLCVATKDEPENYYAVFGQYILTAEVFEELEGNIRKNKLERGEIQLTSALEQTRAKSGMLGYVVDGTSYDVGLPDKYIETIISYRN